eukprot:624027-Pelagomonas_calceolata.AAC.4
MKSRSNVRPSGAKNEWLVQVCGLAAWAGMCIIEICRFVWPGAQRNAKSRSNVHPSSAKHEWPVQLCARLVWAGLRVTGIC